jgi:transcriptional regulator with XRE-family HTH domain
MLKSLLVWRTERLWSVRDLAREAGVSTKTIVQLEHGRQCPTYATMRRIALALDVPAADISEFAAALEERRKTKAYISSAPQGKHPTVGQTPDENA